MNAHAPVQSRHEEYAYLDLLGQILEHGDRRIDRTGVGTLSLFGATMRFSLKDGTLPLLTTKQLSWKSAFRELLWFLSGNTNIRALVEQGVHIWTDWPLDYYRRETGDNISRDEFEKRILEDNEFSYKYGSIGPSYGKQWRNWVAPNGRRIDQIADLIHAIKTNPGSRRLLFHGWNVADIQAMLLPVCHLLYEFKVSSDGKLSCVMFVRSQDVFLGQGWNLAEAAALTFMIAQQTGLTAHELIWMGADVHLYLNHLDQAREQITREPRPFPKLELLRKPLSIDDYKIEDFNVVGYDPWPAIKAPVAV